MVGGHELEFTEWKRLKAEFIDKRRKRHCGKLIDTAAHLMLELGNPGAMLRVAVDYLGRELSPCRIDAGLGTPLEAVFRADVDWIDPASAAPSTAGVPISNHNAVVQRVWRSSGPVAYHDCRHPGIGPMAGVFDAARTRSMMAHRIEHRGEILGMLCIDQTTHARRWEAAEQQVVNRLCAEFLAPLMALGRPSKAESAGRPTKAEMAAIRLAADGLSYKEIAKELGKSVRTIEHQLRSARGRLGASNQADLVRKCLRWL